jgi:putative two-component system response regulator
MNNKALEIPNILIVDDIGTNLAILTSIIKRAGYMPRLVYSAKQAISAIESKTPNLILLDISMPDIDGFDLCSMLKKKPSTREIPVIFISALNSTEDKVRGFQLGAVDYITKPFDEEEVILRINTHLKIYTMRKELEAYNRRLCKIINDQIRKVYEGQRAVLYAMAKLTVAKDATKKDHLERTGRNSKLLAMSMQLSPKFKDMISDSFIETIELAALLHDIGKISIPDHVLLKPAELNTQEREIVKTHARIGADTLREIYSYCDQNEYIRMAIEIAEHHHENWDGTGYPDGLSGTEIPLSARIVSIIDTYDGLISERCYRKALSHEKTMKIINEASGKKFDPDIVQVFNKIQHQINK